MWSFIHIQLENERSDTQSLPVTVVHCISKTWCINDGECKLDPTFFDQHFGLFYLKERKTHTTYTTTKENEPGTNISVLVGAESWYYNNSITEWNKTEFWYCEYSHTNWPLVWHFPPPLRALTMHHCTVSAPTQHAGKFNNEGSLYVWGNFVS